MFRTASLSVTEPHPSVPKSGAYLSGGRGGAGNYKRYTSTEVTAGPSASGPASRVPLSRPSTKRTVPTGRGGAGNMTFNSHATSSSDDNIFQFDEEMIRKREAQVAPVYRIGRGGAGNLFVEGTPRGATSAASRKDSSESSASESERAAMQVQMQMQRRGSGGVLSMFSRRSS